MYTDYFLYDYGRISKKMPISVKKRSYYPDFLCFDIETTSVTNHQPEFSFIYLWQCNVFGDVIIGRTFETFKAALDEILIRTNDTLVIYVHNLSYEFQFLKSYFEFTDILATSTRKVITARSGRIEWRCSMRLANMSLAEFSRIWGGGVVKDEKIDYSIYRSSKEPLEPDVIKYGVMDVISQRAAILGKMEAENDTVASIPLTATGYVRRSVRKHLGYWGIKNMQLPMTREVYELLSEAFRGGNTHANRYYSGQIIRNVKCFDEASAYPHAQCSGFYPVSEFRKSICSNIHLFEKKIVHCCAIIRMKCFSVELRNPFDGFPPMSISKCWYKLDITGDNGRVLAAGAIGVTLTDIDYHIFMHHYKCKSIEIECVYTSRRRQLPPELIKAVYSFFQKKTEYKSVEGKEVEYLRAKEDNNSVYGMSAQKPIFGDYSLQNNLLQFNDGTTDEMSEEEKAEIFQGWLTEDAERRIMPYQYGVWVTANARKNLEIGIKEDTIYVDTDSTYTDRENNIFAKYNAELTQYYKERNMIPYDKHGNPQVLGTFQQEKDVYDEFITWGAKKYAGTVNGNLRITVAGVPKKAGAAQLLKDGGLAAFKPGYVFRCECNSAATYNDDMDIMYRGEHVKSNMHLARTHYKLGIADDYDFLLQLLKKEYTGHVF